MAALLILFSSCVSLAEGIFIKKYNSKHTKGGFIFTAFISLFSMLYFLITDKGGFNLKPEMLPYAVIAGILYCSASFLTFIALGCGSFTLSMLILSYSGVFPVLYGLIFLKETASVFTYIGFAIIAISLFLVRGERDSENKKLSFKWLISILISFFGNGLFTVLCRIQQIKFNNSCTNEFMVITLLFSAITLFIIGLIKDGKNLFYILKHGSLYAASAGISNGLTNALSLIVNTLIPISIYSPIKAGVRIIFSFILSKVIFKESFLKRQVVGVILGAVALVFLNM